MLRSPQTELVLEKSLRITNLFQQSLASSSKKPPKCQKVVFVERVICRLFASCDFSVRGDGKAFRDLRGERLRTREPAPLPHFKSTLYVQQRGEF